jgi:hypothetical protein
MKALPDSGLAPPDVLKHSKKRADPGLSAKQYRSKTIVLKLCIGR